MKIRNFCLFLQKLPKNSKVNLNCLLKKYFDFTKGVSNVSLKVLNVQKLHFHQEKVTILNETIIVNFKSKMCPLSLSIFEFQNLKSYEKIQIKIC